MKMIYTAEEIEVLNDYFKKNSKTMDREEFLNGIYDLINRIPAMYNSFIACYDSGNYLQPGYLTEINICATLAKMFNLEYKDNVCEHNMRHYYSDGFSCLKEYGGCTTADAQYIDKNGKVTTIEIKEPLSVAADYDLGMTEEGKLFPKIAEGKVFPTHAQLILDEFNKESSIFDYLGSNIPLTNKNYLGCILDSYIDNKHIDYIASYTKDNELLYFPVSELSDHVNFKRSEIRTAGKNKVKVYTHNAFKKAMNNINCIIDSNNIVAIPKKNVSFRIARGSNGQVSGIKINSIFFFEVKDILKEDEEYYYANVGKGKQLKQGISVHLNLT